MEDVPYYCPTCHLKVLKQSKAKKTKAPRRRPKAKEKVKQSPAAAVVAAEEVDAGETTDPKPGHDQHSSDKTPPPGLKLKISLKGKPEKQQKNLNSAKKKANRSSSLATSSIPQGCLNANSSSSSTTVFSQGYFLYFIHYPVLKHINIAKFEWSTLNSISFSGNCLFIKMIEITPSILQTSTHTSLRMYAFGIL